MGVIGTFGSFTQARLGIYTSQKGLSITGNNISNINTEGYTRQKLDQISFNVGGADRYFSQYDIRIGNGSLGVGVSQFRDPYLDIRFRSENASVGAMDEKLAGLENIQAVIDEVAKGDDQNGIIEAQLSDLRDKLMNLTVYTGQEEYDVQVRESAKALTEQLRAYAARLVEVKNNTEIGFKQDLDTVNTILTNIRDLNATIRKSEIHGDNALELRDQRNVLIDELSKYMKINVTYTTESIGAGQWVEKLVIKLDNANPDTSVTSDSSTLIDGIYGAQIEYNETTPMQNPDYKPGTKIGDPAYVPGTVVTDADELNRVKAAYKYFASEPVYDDQGKLVGASFTNDPDQAFQEENNNYTLMVSELRDSKDRLFYDIKKTATEGPKVFTDVQLGEAGTVTAPDGTTTITRFVLTGQKQLKDADGKVTGTENYYLKEVYTQTPSSPVVLDDNDLYGSLQATRELLTESGEFATNETITEVDENAASKRGIPYYQRSLDLLANPIATAFNDANKGFMNNEDGAYIDDEGNPITLADGTILTKGMDTANNDNFLYTDENGVEQRYPTAEDYLWANVDPETETLTLKDDAGNVTQTYNVPIIGCNLFSNHGDSDSAGDPNNPDDPVITASNISIAYTWSTTPSIVTTFTKHSLMDEGTTDSENVLHMVNLFDTKMDYMPNAVEPDVGTGVPLMSGTFQEMLTNISSVLGNDMKYTGTMLETYYASSVELDMSRDAVSAVDLNDEAMNLMQYQKSYQAACRLLTTVDSVLDKLINNTGATR